MNPPDDIQTLAALAALELLEGEERATFEALLQQKDATAQAGFAAFQQVATALAWIVPPQAPSPTLRTRLLERVDREAKTTAAQERIPFAPGLTLAFADRIPWQEGAVPGIRIKQLFVDPQRRYASSLVTMAAGTVYPRHRHTQVEELLMLPGDLMVEGQVIRAGDYCRAEPGTWHEVIHTESGCTFIALGSLDDEFLLEETTGSSG